MSDLTDSLTVVRAHFDEVLADHIRIILDMDAFPSGLTLDIATITSLVMIEEREEEIRQFTEAPPKRYTRETFMKDIRDIGLGSDTGIMSGLEPLIRSGLVTLQENGELKAEIVSLKMLQVVNTLFPGMQGMNLVAYMVQTIEEVASGRKDLHDAKNFFVQTLKTHSLAGQFSELFKDRDDPSRKGTFVPKAKKNVSPEWNRSVLEKLSRLRSEKGGFRSDDLQVKEIFRGSSPPPESGSETTPVSELLPEPQAAPVPEPPPEPQAAPVPEPQPEPQAAPVPEPPPEPQAAPVPEPQPEPQAAPVPEPPPEPQELPLAQAVPEPEKIEPEEEEEEDDPADDADIEARIAAFEQTLALTCPLCKTGKLQVNQTEKGKVFYDCSQATCHFISWSQPFHYPCPTCANPFLVAFMTKEGKEGLKCPRATCDYSQDERINPEDFQRKKTKKRKVVRRVKRKV